MTHQHPTSRRAVTIATSGGAVDGFNDGTVDVFLGVPYAQPPFGPNRFRPPVPVQPWSGNRDATRMGPTSPQREALFLADTGPRVNAGEADILHVNIWAPPTPSTAPDPTGLLPVLVWFHGGALIEGSNAADVMNGARLAVHGIVVVSANYRLGAEGFSVLDGAPHNLGLADQIEALRWVQREITAFGGNPHDVTVAGQSAGGVTVAAMMCSPSTAGLMHRVIIQSSPLEAKSLDEAGELTRRIARHLDIDATRPAFEQISPEALLAAQHEVLHAAQAAGEDLGYHVAVDGSTVHESTDVALLGGAGDHLPLLIGVTSEEFMLWMGPNGVVDLIDDATLQAVAASNGVADAVQPYQLSRPDSTPGHVLGRLLSDLRLRAPMIAAVDARAERGADSYVYEFAWQSPMSNLGAAHSVDLPFVFDTLTSATAHALVGTDAPQTLADDMCSSWAAFIRSGTLDWPVWDRSRRVKVFDGSTNPVEVDPHPTERVAMTRCYERSRRD